MTMANLCGMVVGASFPKPVSDAEVTAEYETRSEKMIGAWLRLLRLRRLLLPWLLLPLKMKMMSPTAMTTTTYKGYFVIISLCAKVVELVTPEY
jgi:hypothetical protein